MDKFLSHDLPEQIPVNVDTLWSTIVSYFVSVEQIMFPEFN